MTDDEIEAMAQPWPGVDLDAWQKDVLRLIRRRKPIAMLNDLELDLFDLLAVAPILASEE